MAQAQIKPVLKRKIEETSQPQISALAKPPTKQERIVQQRQSFAMVQTLLLSAVSC